MNNSNELNVAERTDIGDIYLTVKNDNAEADLTVVDSPIDKIRVVAYKRGEVFDSFSMSTKPKSKLGKTLISVIGRILTIKNRNK